MLAGLQQDPSIRSRTGSASFAPLAHRSCDVLALLVLLRDLDNGQVCVVRRVSTVANRKGHVHCGTDRGE